MKLCTKCKQNKENSEFHKSKSHKGGLVNHCKSCVKEKTQLYYQKNQEILKQKAIKYRLENPNFCKDYYKNNPNYFGQYRNQNSEHYRQWRIANRKRTNLYLRNKRATDPNFKLKAYLRSRLSGLIKKCGATKSGKTFTLLGCSLVEFKLHIEKQFKSGMTWENYGSWHLDHIKACANFDLTTPTEQAKCFHYTNFQPLWAKDNLKKGCR